MAHLTIIVEEEVFRFSEKEAAALRKHLEPDVLVDPKGWTPAELRCRSTAREKLLAALFSAERDLMF